MVKRISKPIYKKYYGCKFTDIPEGNVEVIWERPEKKHTISIDGVEKEISDQTIKNDAEATQRIQGDETRRH